MSLSKLIMDVNTNLEPNRYYTLTAQLDNNTELTNNPIYISVEQLDGEGNYTEIASSTLLSEGTVTLRPYTKSANAMRVVFKQHSASNFSVEEVLFTREDVMTSTITSTICSNDADFDEDYRFGFNGQEKDNEIKGTGNSLDFGARVYDSRLGRWLSLDPLMEKYPSTSAYTFVDNSPVLFIDKKGKFKLQYTDEQLGRLGISRLELTRFETIIKNIYKVIENNPEAIEAIANTTGFNADQIRHDFEFNNGPIVEIKPIGGGAESNLDGMVFDPTVVKYLANIEASNKEELSNQTLGVALTVLHEYGHYGDKKSNGGYNTGQFLEESDTRPHHTGMIRKYIIGGNNKAFGTQHWQTSLTGHRGDDIELMGFGVTSSASSNGVISLDKSFRKISSTTDKSSLRNPPTTLPSDVSGETILSTLDVR